MKIVTSINPKSRWEQQLYCVSTWQKYGLPIVAVQPPSELVAIDGVTTKRTENVANDFGRPSCVRISELLKETEDGSTILIVNSDISIKDGLEDFRKNWVNASDDTIWLGVRHNFDEVGGRKREEKYGIDAFRITPAMAQKLPDIGMAIGCPCWDYWIPYALHLEGWNVAKAKSTMLHRNHPTNWSVEDYNIAQRLLYQQYKHEKSWVTKFLQVKTNRTRLRAEPPTQPTAIHRPNRKFHAGDMGDIIYSLNSYIGSDDIDLVLYNKTPQETRRTIDKGYMLQIKELLGTQPYIKSVTFDPTTHHIPTFRCYPNGNLIERQLAYNGISDLSRQNVKTLHLPEKRIAPIVVNHTERYPGNLDWETLVSKAASDIVFVGTKEEHSAFEIRYGKVDFYPTDSLLDLAMVINGAEKFIGNQSLPLALAIAQLKECYIDKTSMQSNSQDCEFNRKNVFYDLPSFCQ